MTDSPTTGQQQFGTVDDNLATAILREAAIGRQQQAGSLEPSAVEDIRMGKQDQSIGFEDAKFALQNADHLWGKAQQVMGDVGKSIS
jgi:hypothetical protein